MGNLCSFFCIPKKRTLLDYNEDTSYYNDTVWDYRPPPISTSPPPYLKPDTPLTYSPTSPLSDSSSPLTPVLQKSLLYSSPKTPTRAEKELFSTSL